MSEDLYINKQVARITGLTQREILSWTEKGLVIPARQAKKAGTMRGYNYPNLLEFGLARVLLNNIGLQFFTTKTILSELREDGEIEMWCSDLSAFMLRFGTRFRTSRKEDLVGSSVAFRVDDPRGLGGTVDFPKDLATRLSNTEASQEGTLLYIFLKDPKYHETRRIISPWDILSTMERLKTHPEFEDRSRWFGMITVNIGQIKTEIDTNIKIL